MTLYPEPKIYLGFIMCLSKSYKDIPERNLIEDCALEHAISFKKLNECATQDDGAYGAGLLRDSVQRSSKVRKFQSPRKKTSLLLYVLPNSLRCGR